MPKAVRREAVDALRAALARDLEDGKVSEPRALADYGADLLNAAKVASSGG